MKIKVKDLLNICIMVFVSVSVASCTHVRLYAKEAKFQKPTPPTERETLVYLFREDTIVGGALGLTYVADNRVVAHLDFGSFTYVKLPSNKFHEIVAVWNEAFDDPKYHYRLETSPGETVYIMFNNALGDRGFGVSKIKKSVAQEFIKTYDYRELKFEGEKIAVSYNEYFDKLITGDISIPEINNEEILKARPLYKKDSNF